MVKGKEKRAVLLQKWNLNFISIDSHARADVEPAILAFKEVNGQN